MSSPADRGQRGKIAEAVVMQTLKKFADRHHCFTFNRVQDARTAGGRGTAAIGDFQAFYSGQGKGSRNFVIEVKEVAHAYRLSYNNFDAGQIARMRIRELAGSIALVLVYHSPTKLWRILPLSLFYTREEGAGSWDLSQTEQTAALALELDKRLFHDS